MGSERSRHAADLRAFGRELLAWQHASPVSMGRNDGADAASSARNAGWDAIETATERA
jgi:hypothetical protein